MTKVIKIKIGLLLFFTAGCGGSWGPNLGALKMDFMSKDEHLRSNMSGTWATCKPTPNGSSKYTMDFTSSKIYVGAQTFNTTDCSGKKYESYKLNQFTYSILVTGDEHRGSTDLTLASFYPNNIEAEEGVSKIKSQAIVMAHVDFQLTPDNKKLHLDVSNIITADLAKLSKPDEVPLAAAEIATMPNKLSFDLDASESPSNVYSTLETNNKIAMSSIRYFNTTSELESQISEEASAVVGKSCLKNYFGGHSSESPLFDSLFTTIDQQNHLKLTSAGYELRGVQVLSGQDIGLTPYIRFWFFYYKGDQEMLSELACKNKIRPSGINVTLPTH